MYKVLICDDEKDIVNAIAICLSAEGYEIFKSHNGREALDIIKANEIDLVLLDVMMPVMDGITCLSEIRKSYDMPVIILSAKSEDVDKILGLNLGADDYITKPFSLIELTARVRSNLRRYKLMGTSNTDNEPLKNGGILLSDKSKEVSVDGNKIVLTKTEYNILKLFMENPGRVFSPKEIYKRVWQEESFGGESTVAVHIRHLREKIEINPAEPLYIKVIWGQGYRMEEVKEK